MSILSLPRPVATVVRGVLSTCVVAAAVGLALHAHAGGLDEFIGVWDAPSRYFPGHYFEQKAQFYLAKKDYAEALRLFELSSYWSDKVSQYNVAIMYYNGIGTPTDRVRAAAWMGIAAQAHDTLADAALQSMYAELSPEQREAAGTVFAGLEEKYGDDVTLPRALRRYQQDASISLFGFGVTGPGQVYTAAGARGLQENSATFAHRMDAERDALIAQIHGHVSVGGVQPLYVPDNAKQSPSHTVLQPPPDSQP